ncbi:HD domain-containing phosphohydrolase [Desulfuromonas sp. AOP6]|uniref:HD-GYP domain-containing protein n=1 Tax=Desulfuromonas sp. AOP6 TaxID=1566351 RepID=UPI00126F3BB5|nr:HD domain-containing phosphohydrolase [Desulfuromonas sp. AOP6]BCA81195.1 HDIG domain-containing protein [Desulfuromonas sp. AOP6]
MLAVGLSLLDQESTAPCDMFRRVHDDDYILFARKGLPLSQGLAENLRENAVRSLYIEPEESAAYFGSLKKLTEQIVSDKKEKSERKAQVVYASCQEILRQVFEDPRASFIHLAMDIIAPTMDLIVTDDVATRCLIKLTDYDRQTYTHSTNVGIFGIALARNYYGQDAVKELKAFGAGFFLHDLGKCRIPLHIINKPGPLTPQERLIVNRHPEDGYKILQENGVMTEELTYLTLQHHERDDGRGYPFGLTRQDIHPYARICRVVDIYEAMTSERPYHRRSSTFDTLKLMKEKLVVDMEPGLFEHFVKLFLT